MHLVSHLSCVRWSRLLTVVRRDFGSLAEDFEFSQDAWRRGFTSGRIHGIVREQSPVTLRDFLKQRRRWFMGIVRALLAPVQLQD